MKRKTILLLLAFIISVLFCGCRYSVRGDASEKCNSVLINQPINPNNERFEYVNSSRTVDGDVVTITFTYKIKEN